MHVEKTLAFRLPRDALWDYLRDPERFLSIGYVERVDVATGQWPRQGTRGTIHVRLREKAYAAPFTIDTYRDGHDLVASLTSGPLKGAAFYFHASDGPGDTSVLRGGFRLGGFMGLAAAASGMQARISHAVERELVAFRDRAESEWQRPSAGPA